MLNPKLFLCLLLLAVAACQTNKNTRDIISEQLGAENIPREYHEGLLQYPKQLGSFYRDKIYVYAPKFDLSNYSIQYFYDENNRHIVNSTYYFYDRASHENVIGSNDPKKVFEITLDSILSTQPGASLISTETAITKIGGKEYNAYRGAFMEEPVINGEKRRFYGEVIIVPLKTKYIKLRMTASRADNDIQQKSGELLRELIAIADAP